MSLSQEEKQHFLSSITFPLIFVIIMWTVKIIETVFHLDFSILGVKPLSVEGLPGIILFHFIHGDWRHLIANTLPILVLGTSLFYFYRSIAVKISLLLMIITGIFVWFGARDGVHIGASAMIYGLAFFLIVSGFIRHNKALTALSFIVVFSIPFFANSCRAISMSLSLVFKIVNVVLRIVALHNFMSTVQN